MGALSPALTGHLTAGTIPTNLGCESIIHSLDNCGDVELSRFGWSAVRCWHGRLRCDGCARTTDSDQCIVYMNQTANRMTCTHKWQGRLSLPPIAASAASLS